MQANDSLPRVDTQPRPARILPVIVAAQFAGASWFAGNAVLPALQRAWDLPAAAVGYVTSAVQLGFIAGTLVFAFLAIADRFSPRLRVKDVDFAYPQIIVRDGKGTKDRVTMLAGNLVQPLQELLGHSDVSTTMIYTHVMNKGARGVKSPLDRLEQERAEYRA